jgi:hypothetical protein
MLYPVYYLFSFYFSYKLFFNIIKCSSNDIEVESTNEADITAPIGEIYYTSIHMVRYIKF